MTRAADELGISQSALSKSVHSLERVLGVKLLERGRFGAAPTPFGLALARHADAIDAELRTAENEVAALKSARHGHISLGCGPSEANRLLPLALQRLRKRAPRIRISVSYGLNESLVPMVKHGEVDFALSSIPGQSNDTDLRHIALHSDTAAVIVRPDHALLRQKSPIEPKQLLEGHWVLARREELERRAFEDLFVQAGLPPPQATIETTSVILMKTLAMQGDFLTFLPKELVYWEERGRQLARLTLAAPSWRRVVGITLRARASPSPASELLIEELRRAAREFTPI
jgi:DNA-binding transcriptional LysR family regulator